jgi:hypothetical protein
MERTKSHPFANKCRFLTGALLCAFKKKNLNNQKANMVQTEASGQLVYSPVVFTSMEGRGGTPRRLCSMMVVIILRRYLN